MPISRRTLARAGVLAVGALTFAACNDSSTAPLQVTPDVLQTMGDNVATQIEGAISTLTAQDVMNSTGGAPTFARVPTTGATMLRGLSFSRSAPGATLKSTTDINQCGSPSQQTPTDSDGDGVPDDWSLTFTNPPCSFVDQSSNTTITVTGVFHISDPTVASAGFGLDFGLTNFKVSFSGAQGSGYVTQNGTGSVTLSSSILQQTENWNLSAVLTGVQSASASVMWNGSFTAAQGQTLSPGHALPDGSYSPNGSFSYHEGNRVATFTIQTLDPLMYSASCAAQVQAGTALSPFTSGMVKVSVSNQQNSGFVEVSYANCNAATVTLVTQ